MTNLDIAQRRLQNQELAQPVFEKPEAVVNWFGAVQAQDYAAAKWALGLRMPGSVDDVIEQAFAAGAILRTHVMRPTWHFVAPADIRWLLALTSPRVYAASAYQYRQLELDDAIWTRSKAVLTAALQGGKQLTRTELGSALQQAGIAVDDLQRLTYILMHAELDGIICSGARRGKQFTYALLDERVPPSRPLARDEALYELICRYFTAHGPATVLDFAWWSGLALSDAKVGVAMARSQLAREVIEGLEYWSASATPLAQEVDQSVHLLPNFDEYTVGYTNRTAIFNEVDADKFDRWGNVLNNVIVINGFVVGTWKRVIAKDRVSISLDIFDPQNTTRASDLALAANRYGTFLGKTAASELSTHDQTACV